MHPCSRTAHQSVSSKQLQMRDFAARLCKQEEGQDLTEYALLLVLVSLAAIAAMNSLATQIGSVFSNASGNLNTGT